MADEPTARIRVEPDIPSASRAGTQSGDAFQAHFNKSTRGLSDKTLGRVRASLKDLGDTGTAGLTHIVDTSKRAEDKINDLGGATRKLKDEMGDLGGAARKVDTAFRNIDVNELKDGIDALKRRAEAFKKSLSKSQIDTDGFALYDHEFRKLIALSDEVGQHFDEISDSPELQADIQRRLKLITTGLGRETQLYKSIAQSERDFRHDAEVGIRQDKQLAANKNIQIARNEHGKEVALTQTSGAKEVAIIKADAAQKLQSSRKTARFRLEIARQLFRQLRTIERSIGAVFKGTAAIVQGAFARVERTVFRIGGVFKRGNKDYTSGLQPALSRREGIIKRSFGRQEANVRGSVARQSATMRRFETQASTGIAGALTGRSSLGALFGGGLAIGGGFSLFRKLSQSIQVGGDFIQGLAVLQAQLQLTGEQMVGVRQLSIDLGNDITLPGVSALDAAQAIAALTKQFGSLGEAALPAAEAAAKGVLSLSRATGASAEDAAAIVGAATNVFGISADDAVATADKITAALTRAAGVGVTEFKDSFTQAANVFALFQKPALGAEGALVELNTAIAVLAKGGLTGSQAGTGLKQFFIQSVKTGDQFVALRRQIAETAGVSGSVFFKADGSARAFTDSIDILRKGLKGMSDEQKSTTLTTLFGARASTVANILISESAESFALLREAQQRQGAAAEVATAQNIGLRGALDALSSVVETQQIKTYEKWQGAAAKVVLVMADLFQKFFDGTGKMEVLRQAIVGVTVALGGLLVLKGAFELTKFLGIGLTGLISPIGILVVGIAALGAAFSILLRSSDDFRTAFKGIGTSLRDAVVPVLTVVGDLFAKFVELINTKVLPAVTTFSVAFAKTLGEQVARFIRFLETGAIPALVRFKDAFVDIAGPVLRDVFKFLGNVANPIIEKLGQLIQITVVPAFNKLSDVLRDKVDPALQKVRDVAGAVKNEIGPLVQPATDAFRALGDAIGAIAGKRVGPGASITDRDFGDLSALIPAFQGVVSGIAQSFANLADRIIEIVGPQIPRLLGWIISQFNEDKLLAIVQAFGRIAMGIGKALGTVASSPEFLGALTAIAGTAAFVALRFIEGFGRGLAVGLPRTLDVLKDELGPSFNKLLKAVFNPLLIAKAIIGGFVIAGLASSLFKTMQRPMVAAGTQAGQVAGQRGGLFFAKSFAASAGGAITGAASRNQFASGFFGGLDGIDKQAKRIANRATGAMVREQHRAADTLRVLGRTPTNNIGRAFIGPVLSETAVKAVDGLIGKYGEAAVAGAELRARNTESFNQIKVGAQGLQRIIGGEFRAGFSQATTAAQGFMKSLGATLRATGKALKASAIGVGQAIGGAMMAGIGGVLSGQQLGKAEGTIETGLSLAGLFASALFGGAAVGGGVQGAVVGGTILTLGLITAAVTKSGEAAKEAAGRIDTYKEAILGAKDAAGQQTDLTRVITDTLASGSDVVRDAFVRGGFRADLLAAAILAGEDAGTALAGAVDIGKALDGLPGGLDGLKFAQEFYRVGEEAAQAAQDAIDEHDFEIAVNAPFKFLQAPGTFPAIEIPTTFVGPQLDDVDQDLLGLYNRAHPIPAALVDIKDALDTLNRVRTEALQGELADVTGELDVLTQAVSDAKEVLLDLIDGDYQGTLLQVVDDALLAVPQIAVAVQEALRDTFADGKLSESGTRKAVEQFGALVTGVLQKAIADAEANGITLTPKDLADSVQPILDLIPSLTIEVDGVEVALDDATVKRLQEEARLRIGNPEIEAQLSFLGAAAPEIKKLQDLADQINVDIQADVIFSAKQINDQLTAILGAGGFTRLDETSAADAQLLLAQAAARQAALVGVFAPLPGGSTVGNGGIIFNNEFFISSTDPIAAAEETVRANVSAASGGRYGRTGQSGRGG